MRQSNFGVFQSQSGVQSRKLGSVSHLLSSVESVNIGRQFAGSMIRESIALDKKLNESINAGLIK